MLNEDERLVCYLLIWGYVVSTWCLAVDSRSNVHRSSRMALAVWSKTRPLRAHLGRISVFYHLLVEFLSLLAVYIFEEMMFSGSTRVRWWKFTGCKKWWNWYFWVVKRDRPLRLFLRVFWNWLEKFIIVDYMSTGCPQVHHAKLTVHFPVAASYWNGDVVRIHQVLTSLASVLTNRSSFMRCSNKIVSNVGLR